MKQLFCLLTFYFFVSNGFAQSVVNSTGASFALTEYSVGEPVAGEIVSSNFSLSQGVIQSQATGQTISTSAVDNQACAGKSIQVPFTTQGTYNPDNVFTAQLSNASGDFSNSVSIGSLTGSVAGIITGFIPANTPLGTGYRIRVVSSNPGITGTDNGSNIEIKPYTSLLDMSFNAPAFNGGIVRAFALDKVNGIAYIGRALQTQASGNIASFNIETGAVNTAFFPGTGFNFDIFEIAYHPSGKIIVGGRFTSYNGASTPYLACLNPDGSLDNVFHTNIGTGPNGFVRTIAVDYDGSIVVGGNFSSFNGSACKLKRLNIDGTSGAGIASPGINGADLIQKIIPDPLTNGNLYVGGKFYRGIMRLSSTGVPVDGFNVGTGGAGSIMAFDNNGNIILAGQFTKFNNQSRNGLAKINAVTGALDASFQPALPPFGLSTGKGHPSAVAVHPDGRIFVGRDYWNKVNSISEAISILDPVTGAFHADNSLIQNLNGYPLQVLVIEMMDDGKILVGGSFSNYGGVGRKSMLKLLPEPLCTANPAARQSAGNEFSAEDVIENDLNQPLVYPNPTTNTVNIKYASVSSVSIMNIQGQTVLTAPEQDLTEGVELQVHKLPAGIYFVKITSPQGADKVSKLIKQ